MGANLSYTAGDVRARVSGSQFFAGFGAVWLLVGLGSLHRFQALPVALVVVVAAMLFAAGLGIHRRSSRLPEVPLTAAEQAHRARVFRIANIAQYAAMPVVSVALILLRLPDYILASIAIIVGLHLLPIAGPFRYPPHYVTGVAVIAWSTGCMLTQPRSAVPGHAALVRGWFCLSVPP